MAWRTRIVNLLLALCSTALALGAVEAWVRWTRLWFIPGAAEQGIYEPSGIPGVPYRMRKNLDQVWGPHRLITNSEGLRDTREYGDKPANTKRVLVIGDSFTFGFGVAQSDPFPQQLERLLGHRYEVINAGVSGFNAQDEAHFLAYLLPRVKPDLVLWAVVGNDWDDSLGVAPDGKLATDLPSYAATSEWLAGWGLEGPYVYRDFSLCMNPASLAWAEGRPYAPRKSLIESAFDSTDGWLKRHWYTWAYARSLAFRPSVLDTRPPLAGKPYHARVQKLDIGDGQWDAPPEYLSIYLSPHYKKGFVEAIRSGAQLAGNANVPMVIYGFSIPFEQEMLSGSSRVWYRDITQYVGGPYYRFYLSHILGWDGHLNRAGHAVIAESILQTLEELHLVEGVDFRPRRKFYDKTRYWQLYAQNRDRYIADFIGDYIDFDRFNGIHQLVGGLYPPRVFPINGGARLSLILKPGGDHLTIRGTNQAQAVQQIGITLESASQTAQFDASLNPGPFQISFTVPREFVGSGVVDVLVDCKSSACRDIRMQRIGLQQ